MPWYAWLYVGYLGVLAIAAVHSAVPDEDPMHWTIVDLVAAACEIGFVFAWYRGVTAPHAALVIAALAFVLFWFVAECARVIVKHRRSRAQNDSEAVPPRMIAVALTFSAIRLTPALVAGIGVLRRSLH